MKLALVIPVLNEEEAIASTLRRCLEARERVVDETDVDEMTVVFVNDGSTDRTQQIVDQIEFDEVVKVRFEKNRGYGAAIQAGWEATDAELVGFMDADGTCDPGFCVQLVNRITETEADVVLASRLNPDSKMPFIRRIGNSFFAWLLGFVSRRSLTDCASGFRIVRRSSLRLMSPLPSGLHFTPAMSCICLLDPRLRIEEIPMPYEERLGRSKLSVTKDGIRFLYTILFSACCYTPLKTMMGASLLMAVCGAIAVWVALLAGGSSLSPTVVAASFLLVILLLLSTGMVLHQLNFLLIGPRSRVGRAERLLQYLLYYKRLFLVGAALGLAGVTGVLATFLVPAAASGGLLMVPLFVLLVFAGGCGVVVGIIVRVIWAVGEKQAALVSDRFRVTEADERTAEKRRSGQTSMTRSPVTAESDASVRTA